MNHALLILFYIVLVCITACEAKRAEQAAGHESPAFASYAITVRSGGKDSSFVLSSYNAADTAHTEIRVSDPECTECKDCYLDSGTFRIPAAVLPYITWEKDLYLTDKNPYVIEGVPYQKYALTGYLSGVRKGYPVFFVETYTHIK